MIGPVFTCEHVHQAIAASGSPWKLVDAAEDGFLMAAESVRAARHGQTCTVFCEVFGHVYDLSDQSRYEVGSERGHRILDMAVTVPNRPLLERLAGTDVALLSFGAGKCMTAGWGGIGFTRDPGLAAEIRSLRDSSLTEETGLLRFTRTAELLARTALYSRPFYGMARRVHDRPTLTKLRTSGLQGQFEAAEDGTSSGYWHLPSTAVDRRLSQENLVRAEEYERKRLAHASRYRDNLSGVAGIHLPPPAQNALSHFTVRVSAHRRPEVRRDLWQAGVDVGTYFAFPPFLSRNDYPNAHRLSSEVINLPLGPGLDDHDIDRISEVLIRRLADRRDQSLAAASPAT